METLGKRVKKVIVYHGATMTSFAKELNISQSMVSKICADKAVPSDRTISDICRIFNVNKDWLLYGTGDMVDVQSLETELAESFNKENNQTLSDEVKRGLISMFANTPPAAWSLIVDHIKNLADECNKYPDGAGPYIDGYKEGVRMAQAVKEMIDGLSEEPEE